MQRRSASALGRPLLCGGLMVLSACQQVASTDDASPAPSVVDGGVGWDAARPADGGPNEGQRLGDGAGDGLTDANSGADAFAGPDVSSDAPEPRRDAGAEGEPGADARGGLDAETGRDAFPMRDADGAGEAPVDAAGDVGEPDVQPQSDAAPNADAMAGCFAESAHLSLGVPADSTPADDLCVDHGVFVLSYSAARRDANWVAWRLSVSDLGDAKRQDRFHPDDQLPESVYRVKPQDFTGSGYDRGHLCPSADRTQSSEANERTFVMTNMHPQLHDLNAGPWEELENYERDLARSGRVVMLVAGGVFDAVPPTIGPSIAVPRSSFKIVVVLSPGQGWADVTRDTSVFAVLMPNDSSAKGKRFAEYLVSVDRLEAETGYDFLDRIPEPISSELEAKVGSPP